MPEANEREKILRLILQKHCRESVHCDCAVDRALLEVETLMHVPTYNTVPLVSKCQLSTRSALSCLTGTGCMNVILSLQNEVVEEGGRHVRALTLLAERTAGYSGSDLHDLCALAAQQPILRLLAQHPCAPRLAVKSVLPSIQAAQSPSHGCETGRIWQPHSPPRIPTIVC